MVPLILKDNHNKYKKENNEIYKKNINTLCNNRTIE